MSYYFFDPFEDLMDDWFFGFPRVSRRRQAAIQQQQQQQQQQYDDQKPAKANGVVARPQNVMAIITPRVDFKETPEAYEINAELAGVPRDQVKVELHGDLLTIRGEKREENRAEEKDEGGRVVYLRTERAFGAFERSLKLPKNVDRNSIKATHKDGVLNIVINKLKKDEDEKMNIEVTEA
jgi:HSP20 family protein